MSMSKDILALTSRDIRLVDHPSAEGKWYVGFDELFCDNYNHKYATGHREQKKDSI
jgi:hypothetical protein